MVCQNRVLWKSKEFSFLFFNEEWLRISNLLTKAETVAGVRVGRVAEGSLWNGIPVFFSRASRLLLGVLPKKLGP